MGFLDRLKGVFGGRKKEQPSLEVALENQVLALENRLMIHEHAKRVEGGMVQFEMAYDETRQMLDTHAGEGTASPAVEMLRKRADLCALVARLLHEENPDKKKQMCERFVQDFGELRPDLHFRTRTKYERVRIDYESGRMR